MEQNIKQATSKNDEISIKEIIETIQKYWSYLLSKWVIILIVGLSGGGIGLIASLILPPKYTARLSFALIENSGGMSGLADLASTFGFSGLIGGNADVFSGDNLLEIISSKYAIEETLLTPVDFNGEKTTLANVFLEFSGLKTILEKKIKQNPELKNISFPAGQPRENFNRTQDSVLNVIYQWVGGPKTLSIARKNKKVSIVNLNFTSTNEKFSKLFIETLMDQTYRFYSQTRTAQIRANIDMMQNTADSIKALYDASLYKGAGFSTANINPALQTAAVPRLKEETNAKLYGTVYTEVLKNLETLKLDMARVTPIVQIIDKPRLPLFKQRLGKAKGIVIGGILGGLLIVGYLVFKEIIKENTVDV